MNNITPGHARFEIFRETPIASAWESVDSYDDLDNAMAEASDLSQLCPWRQYEVVDGEYGDFIARWEKGDVVANGDSPLYRMWLRREPV